MRPLSVLFIVSGLMAGCEGPPGQDGVDGVDGVDGINGVDGVDGQDGQDGKDGEDGKDTTVPPADAHGMTLTFDNLVSTDKGDGTFDVVLTFTIKKDGVSYIDADGVPGSTAGLPGLSQKTFYAVQYDATTMKFDKNFSFDTKTIKLIDANTGTYTITAAAKSYAPELANSEVYGYVADEEIDVETPDGSGVHLYDYVGSDALTYGTAATTPYESPANVEGCEGCHGAPYMKHGYREAQVEGLGDFAACKTCHYDTRDGGHQDWQIIVDNPVRYAEIHNGSAVTTEEKTKYAYKATLMNDVHMAHAMEFPYPQRMSNCVQCHEGKLESVLADENFTMTTCKSCHPVTGDATYGTSTYALKTIWKNAGVEAFHSETADCTTCHNATGAGKTVLLADLHNGGYDPKIYSADGVSYADALIITVDSASFNKTTNSLTVTAKVNEAIDVDKIAATDVSLSFTIGLYPFESKDFYAYVSATPTSDGAGTWTATVSLSTYATDISGDKLRRIEIAARPTATIYTGAKDTNDGTCGTTTCASGTHCETGTCKANDDLQLAPIAPSRTFDLDANAFSDDYYPKIVDVDKCDKCHDALATTFHSPNRSGNIAVCRMCHNPTTGGSHLEMQSRSLDSYIHAIHSFQPFDPGDVNMSDAVAKTRYEMHMEHRFPNFTIKNCQGCHNPGMFEVPDQSMTLPAVLSASDTVVDRDIKNISSVVVGPGARACGACHRAMYINADDFNGLVSFNRHTALNGYALPYVSSTTWNTALNTVMYYFGEATTPDTSMGVETCAVCHEGQGAEHQMIYNDYIDPE